MSRFRLASSFGLILGAVLALPALAAEPVATPPHWEYGGPHGQTHWGALDKSFESCAIGHRQSPIDIRGATAAPLPALQFEYQRVDAPAIVNNGHTVQVTIPPGQFLTVGDKRLELLQFHFHTPSEERINGKASSMVAHLVHRDADGHLGVVAVLLEAAKTGSAFDGVLEHLPRRAGETVTVANWTLDLAALLPKTLDYYDFEGSLTTPPCSEGVHWMVLRQPVPVLARHVREFRQIFAANARKVQPLYGREVRVSAH